MHLILQLLVTAQYKRLIFDFKIVFFSAISNSLSKILSKRFCIPEGALIPLTLSIIFFAAS